MGNCLNFLSLDDDDPELPSLLPSPSLCVPPNMKGPRSLVDGASPLIKGQASILPFRAPSVLAALYEIGPELGRGQFGIIRKCTNRASGISLACKSISKLRLRTIHDIKGVVREINIMKCLSSHMPPNDGSRNIVRLHEVIEDSASVHLIIELCSGGELFDRIVKVKRYSEAQAARVMKSLLETLQFCHSMGIMHRDLKPENLLLVDDSDESDIKLADFGLALEFSPGQKFSGIAGSAYYIAPEVLHGEYSEEVDIWSAGVIMYALLSGVPPFWGRTEEGIFNAIQEGQVDLTSSPWQTISPSAKDLVTQMLCVDVKLRCTPAQALEHPWISLHTTEASKPFPPLNIDQVSESSRDVESFTDQPASFPGDTLIHKEHENAERSGILTTELLVNFNNSATVLVDSLERSCTKPELSKLIEALVAGLYMEGLSISESLSKLRLQTGWTCTLLTTSATEETLMVDMGQEKYLIAHDRLRKRIWWKVLRLQCYRRIDEKITSVHSLQKLQPVF